MLVYVGGVGFGVGAQLSLTATASLVLPSLRRMHCSSVCLSSEWLHDGSDSSSHEPLARHWAAQEAVRGACSLRASACDGVLFFIFVIPSLSRNPRAHHFFASVTDGVASFFFFFLLQRPRGWVLFFFWTQDPWVFLDALVRPTDV